MIGRCIYGVDLNPLAAELAKVSLWLEAMEPGKPLSFLDAHIRVGNSLLGTTPALLADGVPDDAFKPLTGDDKKVATAMRKRNKAGARRAGSAAVRASLTSHHRRSSPQRASTLARLRRRPRPTSATQATEWADYLASDDYRHRTTHADAWCAAFVWPLAPRRTRSPPPTAVLPRIASRPRRPGTVATPSTTVRRIAAEYQFFHWHLEFPEVFRVSGRPTRARTARRAGTAASTSSSATRRGSGSSSRSRSSSPPATPTSPTRPTPQPARS